MSYLAYFFAGAFLCNAIPHLVSGLQGHLFPTPFAKPSGKGDSSPLVNFLWGALNALVGSWLLLRNPTRLGLDGDLAALVAGGVLTGIWLSIHFGRVQAGKPGGKR